MRMVIGGVAQGKLIFAKDLATKEVKNEATVSDELKRCVIVDETYKDIKELYQATIVNHFHLIIRRLLIEGASVSEITEQILRCNPGVILVTTEIGYGIVPIDKFERTYREQTGRICCTLASNAREVYRITCGIPMQIK